MHKHTSQRSPCGRILAVLLLASHAVLADKPLGDLTGPWELVLDDHLVASKDGITRTYHPFKKHPGNPIIVSDQPWEGGMIRVNGVLPNEAGNGYRMWYSCWAPSKDPEKGHALYALSQDGLRWDKPKLGLNPWMVTGSKENNIIDGGGWVMHTPDDPDPARRYKSVGSKASNYYFKFSPDGINWKSGSRGTIFSAGDTCRVMWDSLAGKYRGFAKMNATVGGLRRRAVGYSEGTGVESWPALRLVMAPDDLDDRWVKPGSIQRTHFYVCPVVAYQNMYLGFLPYSGPRMRRATSTARSSLSWSPAATVFTGCGRRVIVRLSWTAARLPRGTMA